MIKQLGLFALVALSNGAAAASATSSECADILIISTRGSTEYEPEPPTVAADSGGVVDLEESPIMTGEGEMGQIAEGVQKNTTGLKIVREANIYPALIDTPMVYYDSYQKGSKSLVKVVQQATKQCKDQKLVLMGFSQGAHIVADVLSGPGGGIWGEVLKPMLDPETYADQIAAVVLWGDPRHNQAEQKSFVVGSPTAKQDGYFPRTTNQTDILLKYYGKKIVSYCTEGDKYCSSGVLGENVITANNYSSNIHSYSYLNSSVIPAVTFIQEHIKEFKPTKSGNSGTSGASSDNATETASTTASASPSASKHSAASHLKYSATGILAVVGIVACQIFL